MRREPVDLDAVGLASPPRSRQGGLRASSPPRGSSYLQSDGLIFLCTAGHLEEV